MACLPQGRPSDRGESQGPREGGVRRGPTHWQGRSSLDLKLPPPPLHQAARPNNDVRAFLFDNPYINLYYYDITNVFTLDMQKILINVKTDKQIKQNAQSLAKELGLSLS